MSDLKSFGENIIGNLEQVIVGKSQSLELVVIGLLCQGHVLIEDVPGVGKTMLARAAAMTPAGRLVTPEDVAELVAFLCTPAARMIVGQTIMQDGGAALPFTGALAG